MATVRLIIDPLNRSRHDPSALLVGGDGDYAGARARIHAALEGEDGGDVTVVVRHPALRDWFSDLRTSPGVRYEVYSPRDDFARAYGVSLPPGLLDADVVELDLEGLARSSPPNGGDIDGWIVTHRLGAVWVVVPPPTQQLVEVVATLIAAPLHNVWILERVRQQLTLWAERDTTPRAELWRFLARDPVHQRATALVAHAAIARYPKPVRKEWLGDLWQGLDVLDTLDSAADELRRVALPAPVRQRLDQHVRAFLAEKGETADIKHLFSYTTGTLPAEARVLARVLLDRPEELTQETWRLLEAIAWSDDRALLERVRLRLPMPAPDAIPAEWTAAQAEDVVAWVEGVYLPWYRAVRYREETVDADAVTGSFARWVGRSYPDLLNRHVRRTVMGARDYLDDLVTSGRAAIWIVVDALGPDGASALAAACQHRGMQVTGRALQVTMLPTITSVAKPALLAGVPPANRSAGSGVTSLAEYRRIVEGGRWGAAGAAVGADWEQQRLVDLVGAGEASIWVYLVNRLDSRVVHARMGFEERMRQMQRVCDDLAEMAREAQEEAHTRYGYRPAVVFSADHGYTTPAPGATRVETDLPVSHGRCIALGAEDTPPVRGLARPRSAGAVRTRGSLCARLWQSLRR